MLDLAGRIMLAEAPQLLVYRDHVAPARFYAVPAAPRLARDGEGNPLMDLLLYGRRQGSEVELLGGQLMLTTDLALTAAERGIVLAALRQQLADEAVADSPVQAGKAPAPEPELFSPDWTEGDVEVRLADGLVAAGKPSLMGDNSCALSLSLDQEQALRLREAWEQGLPGSCLRYRAEVSAASVAAGSTRSDTSSTVSGPGRASVSSLRLNAFTSRTEATRQPLDLQGPVPLSSEQLRSRLQITAL